MFGIFYGLFCWGAKGVGKFQQSLEDERRRQDALRDGNLTYWGKNGRHLTSNGRCVREKIDSRGHTVISDLYTGQVYHDLTMERQNKIEQEELNKGNTVVLVDAKKRRELGLKVPDDIWIAEQQAFMYLDIRTHKLLANCYVNQINFYIDTNGKLVRIADRERCNNKTGNLTIQQIIDCCNRRQIILPDAPDPYYEAFQYDMYITSRKYLQGDLTHYSIDDNGNFIVKDRYGKIVNY